MNSRQGRKARHRRKGKGATTASHNSILTELWHNSIHITRFTATIHKRNNQIIQQIFRGSSTRAEAQPRRLQRLTLRPAIGLPPTSMRLDCWQPVPIQKEVQHLQHGSRVVRGRKISESHTQLKGQHVMHTRPKFSSVQSMFQALISDSVENLRMDFSAHT
jgi:hypothetical protein